MYLWNSEFPSIVLLGCLPEQGCEKLVVVLTRDMEYRKKPMSPLLVKLFLKKYPKIAERLLHRHICYNNEIETLKEWEQEGKAFVIPLICTIIPTE